MAKVTLNDLSKVLGLNEKEPKKDFHYYGTIVSSNPTDRTYEVSINRDQNVSVEAARLVGAAVGDTVMVTVMANGYATVTGRLGGDLDATDAQRAADNAADAASSAMGTASSALSNAQQANQAATAARTLAEHAEEEAGRAHTAAEQAAEDASSAATSASSANTSAQNAAADASRAAASASSAETDAARASTAATNAESDASRAATSASNAEADAASAATSAQNAANDASSAASSASSASTSASNAAASASTAQQQASAATTAANEAKAQAQDAETAANEAKTDANTAKRDAASANAAANGAVASLAITQGVVDALGQDMDDMQTHVAMMDAVGNIPAGLHVVPSSGGYFMVIANDGVYVYDNESVLVAKYGHDISFDSNREHKIGNNTNYIRYYDANNDGVADSIEVVANNIRLGSYSVADKIAEAKKAGTDAASALSTYKTANDARVKAVEDGLSSTDEYLANYITSQEDVIEDLQNQIDGAIDTWYYSGDPTLSNQPAVAWTTDETKENHLRDLYFNTQNGHSFRFAKEGNTYKWIQIEDADAIKALADAAAAQGTANVKKRVFVAQPTSPYDIGDLWVQGSTGDIKRCATAKTSSQSFAAADWVLASKYTDDTKANAVESDLHTNYYVKSDFSVEPDKIASTISATETTVKTYADNKASAAESNAKTYADNNFDGKGSAASALSDAKDYADDNFDSKGSASAAQAAAISAAAADATSKANAAESNAKADTTNKLKSYYTKTQTDSAITQKADNILSTVSTTYQTKADMDDYSTTAEMNSAIDQKADSITSTVSQTYATKTQAQGYADTAESNAKTAAATDATNKADAAKAAAISTASTDATNKANAAKQAAIDDAASKYYNKTETYTKSEIEQKAGEISLSVAQEEVSKVEVGGRNLVLDSHNGWTSTSYNIMMGTLSEDWIEGETYTIQIKGTPSEDHKLGLWRDNGHAFVCYFYDKKAGYDDIWIKTFECPEPSTVTTYFNKFSIYDVTSAGNHNASIEWVKIEKGNKATDWTPAPEDLEDYTDTKITEAKAAIKVTTDAIETTVSNKVGNSEIISKINQSAESVKIQANKVEIDGTATFNAIKSQADAAYDAKGAADAKKSIHTLTATTSDKSTQATLTYAQALSYSQEGRTGLSVYVPSVTGINIGDTVRLAYKITDTGLKDTIVYIVGTVTSVNTSSSYLVWTSHGLDTTVIDGGNILTNSITANQIKGNTLTLGQISTEAQSEILNSNVDVPTKVSDLTNDSGFQNASQVESTVTGKGYQTSSQVESAITSKGYQTATQVSNTATAKADAAAWSVELETTSINLLENKATIKATVYKYGVKQTSGFTRAWYKNGSVISGQTGESIVDVTADALYTCAIT